MVYGELSWVGQLGGKGSVDVDIFTLFADILRQHHFAQRDSVVKFQAVNGHLVLLQLYAQHIVFVSHARFVGVVCIVKDVFQLLVGCV